MLIWEPTNHWASLRAPKIYAECRFWRVLIETLIQCWGLSCEEELEFYWGNVADCACKFRRVEFCCDLCLLKLKAVRNFGEQEVGFEELKEFLFVILSFCCVILNTLHCVFALDFGTMMVASMTGRQAPGMARPTMSLRTCCRGNLHQPSVSLRGLAGASRTDSILRPFSGIGRVSYFFLLFSLSILVVIGRCIWINLSFFVKIQYKMW